MDWCLDLAINGTLFIDRLADDIKDAAKGSRTDRNHNGGTSIDALLASHETLSGLHGNCAHGVLSQVLGDLENKARGAGSDFDLECIENRGKRTIELNVDDGTNDLGDTALALEGGRRG